MSKIMAVLLNGIAQLEYDRDQLLPEQQRQYLEKMDEKMNAGITLGGQTVADPDSPQRAQFVAQNLAQAIKTDNQSMALALTSWLASRLPELKQVKLEQAEAVTTIELVFDEEYGNQVAVPFSDLH
ncbi:hypothetical protein MNBD_GAMMA24-2776 [hydrothermal vent metagenome]|uniref:Uncharacterized protein n=1 Tax=hydrothermal vent metagenome TaxID=652676 RepID=A0A3B1C8Y6_9ZZZZ